MSPITAFHPRYGVFNQTFWFNVTVDYDGFSSPSTPEASRMPNGIIDLRDTCTVSATALTDSAPAKFKGGGVAVRERRQDGDDHVGDTHTP